MKREFIIELILLDFWLLALIIVIIGVRKINPMLVGLAAVFLCGALYLELSITRWEIEEQLRKLEGR